MHAAWPRQAAADDSVVRSRTRVRSFRPLAEFTTSIRERNEGLARLDCLPLIDEEFYAARLYTGPMFVK